MSSVIIAGNTSGTITLDAPNVAGTTTLTLPTTSGTITTKDTNGILSVNGVQFPATQSASADANCLDDYEEGTWTPTIGGGATYTSIGNYTKVGKIVAVNVYLDCTNWGSLSGTLGISGLPFTNGDRISVGAGREDFATGVMLEVIAVSSASYLNILAYNNATVIPGGANRRVIAGSITYIV
jgi:hypothetical protein